MADTTFLRSVGRVNIDHRHAHDSHLVVDELSKLIEAPRKMFAPLGVLNRSPLPDSFEISSLFGSIPRENFPYRVNCNIILDPKIQTQNSSRINGRSFRGIDDDSQIECVIPENQIATYPLGRFILGEEYSQIRTGIMSLSSKVSMYTRSSPFQDMMR